MKLSGDTTKKYSYLNSIGNREHDIDSLLDIVVKVFHDVPSRAVINDHGQLQLQGPAPPRALLSSTKISLHDML